MINSHVYTIIHGKAAKVSVAILTNDSDLYN